MLVVCVNGCGWVCWLFVCMGVAGSAVVCDSGRSDGCACWLYVCMGVAGSAVPVIGGEVWLCVCVCGGGDECMNMFVSLLALYYTPLYICFIV